MRNLRVQTKTIIVFVSIILFIPSCVWWKNFLSTFFFENIHRPSTQNGKSNKIKSSSLYDTKLESGELVKGQRLLFVEYDENGNVTHSTNGYFESFFTYEDNRCIEAKIFRDKIAAKYKDKEIILHLEGRRFYFLSPYRQ